MDYAFFPPEINSARIYSGPGSGSLLAAAGSWDSLSAELGTTAQTYESVLSTLTALHWRGPASESMTAAATPYVQWLTTTAQQTKQTAMQATAAAAAFDQAFGHDGASVGRPAALRDPAHRDDAPTRGRVRSS